MSYITGCLSWQQFTANNRVLRVQDVINILGAVF